MRTLRIDIYILPSAENPTLILGSFLLMFRLALVNFVRLCRANVLFSTLSFFCLMSAFVSFLFIQGRGYYMYTKNIEGEQANRVLYFTCDDTTTIKSVYEKLANDPMLPKMEIVTVSNEQYAGIDWNRKLNEEVWYTPYGRFFSSTEMESGSDVALLGTSYISQLTQDNINTIWETGINIDGIQFSAIGNFFYDWASKKVPSSVYKSLPMPAAIVIPLKTYFNVGLSATRFRCVFARPLTNTQLTLLSDLIKQFNNIYSLSLPVIYNMNAVNSYISEIAPYALIIILSLLSIVSVVIYWLLREFERYIIYLLCGAKRRQIIFLLSLNITLLVSFSYVCACFVVFKLMKITPEGIITQLPWQFYSVIYIVSLLFTLLTVNIRATPIVFREKEL